MTSFTSAALGQIHSPVNILKEFLATFNRRHKCKAAILSWLDGKHYYGHEWVRVTFSNLANILGYCRETISRHIKELVFDGLIEEQLARRFPKDTAYEYKLNLDNLTKIIESSRCEKFDTSVPDISIRCANYPPTLETNLNLLKNNNTDVGEVENEEVDWEAVARETQTWEQAQICECVEDESVYSAPISEQVQTTRYVDELEIIDSTSEIDTQEDNFPGAEVEVISNTDKPNKQEIVDIYNELRRLRINPEPCLGVVKKYWANVPGAIARVKEAVAEGWCDNPTGLFINSCRSGAKGKNTVTGDVSAWFEWARQQRIVLAMSGGVVYTPSGEAVDVLSMMRRFPMRE